MPLFKRLGCSELFINTNRTETVSNLGQKDPIHHGVQRERTARREAAARERILMQNPTCTEQGALSSPEIKLQNVK